MEDYSKLKGTELLVNYNDGMFDHSTKCFVAHIDRAIGITIKDIECQSEIYCLNKETIEGAIKECLEEGDVMPSYDSVFDCAVGAIKSGVFSQKTDTWSIALVKKFGEDLPGQSICAFDE